MFFCSEQLLSHKSNGSEDSSSLDSSANTEPVKYCNGNLSLPIFSKEKVVLKPIEVATLLFGKDTVPPAKVCTVQPLRVQEHATFIVNLPSLKLTSDVKCDDIGIWNNNSNDKFFFKVSWTDDLEVEILRAKNGGKNHAVLKREYYTLKHDNDFRKRIDFLYCKFKNF